MKTFSDEIIEEIKLNNDILDVVSEYVKMSKKGKDYFGLCPFHSEKTASFSVVPGKGIFYCFGCSAGGSVIQFIMKTESLSYFEALEFLAVKAGIKLPEETDPEYAKKAKTKEQILDINKKAAQFYFDSLKESKKAKEYLTKRKIKNEVVIKYGIGYAGDDWRMLSDHLKREGFSEDDMLRAGLSSRNKNGEIYDKFRNRIMFPIFDVYGNVIAFGGRVIDDSQPKYLNSQESAVYSKGKHLYGLNFAKKTSNDFFILVEGYMDVVVMCQEGIDSFIASLGTALTLQQARLAARYDKKIIIAYDNDEAGKNATLRAIETFSGIGTEPLILMLEGAKDPDEYVRKNGIEDFKRKLQKALTAVEFKVILLKEKYSQESTQDRVNLLKGLTEILSQIEDMTTVDLYAARYSNELKISKDAIMNDLTRNRTGKTENATDKRQKQKDEQKIGRIGKYELLLLLYFFNFKTGKEQIIRYFENDEVSSEKIKNAALKLIDSKKDIIFSDILDCFDEKYVAALIKLNELVENIENKDKALKEFFEHINSLKLERSRALLKDKGKDGTLDKDDLKRLREYADSIGRIKKSKED